MQKKKIWNILKPVLKIGFTILALWLVYTKVDVAALRNIWANANPWPVPLAVMAFIVGQIISSYRLLQFFKSVQIPIPAIENMKLYLLGMFYNLFLPGGIGGDGYKIISLKKKYNTTHKEVFTAVFFDRLCGLWALFFLLVILSSFLVQLRGYLHWIIIAFCMGTVAYYFVLRYFFSRVHQHFFTKHILAIGSQGLQLVCVAFILMALGSHGNYMAYFFVFLLSALATLFPFSVGGLGAREVAIMWCATTFALNKDVSVSITLCFYLITMLISFTAVFFLFKRRNKVLQ